MKKATIIFAILVIVISLSGVCHAQDAVVINDGEFVLQMINGKMFIGSGVAINGPFITLFGIRYPSEQAMMTIPSGQLTMVYQKGQLQQPLASKEAFKQ